MDEKKDFQSMSVQELSYSLSQFVPAETVKILEDEGIFGSLFLELTNQDFQELKVKMAPRKFLKKLSKECKVEQNLLVELVVQNDGSLRLEKDNNSNIFSVPQTKIPKITNFSGSDNIASTSGTNCTEPTVNRFSNFETVMNTLLNHCQGPKLIKAANSAFTEEDRRSLVRVLVAELIKVHGHYPPDMNIIMMNPVNKASFNIGYGQYTKICLRTTKSIKQKIT
ncbi:uncharacterized protein LOC122510577 isoform X3 [Leptopilina heterotoma]|uniref:uncharacterized protein LOC122510577 isoform X3 n=1 Tax=Leptopilina heterotoma TaxID=63436 RepID=UPI001CA837CB|nr:uncharacterized protein LOC122510577 isoform X3 [Leptopilina heterotoma]